MCMSKHGMPLNTSCTVTCPSRFYSCNDLQKQTRHFKQQQQQQQQQQQHHKSKPLHISKSIGGPLLWIRSTLIAAPWKSNSGKTTKSKQTKVTTYEVSVNPLRSVRHTEVTLPVFLCEHSSRIRVQIHSEYIFAGQQDPWNTLTNQNKIGGFFITKS